MEMGVMTPNQVPVQSLQAREVGCSCQNINDVLDAPCLDFFCRSNASCVGCRTDVMEMGVMTPNQVPVQSLQAREVGCLCRNINDVLDACVEDTIHLSKKYKATVQEGKMIEPRPGYADSVPIVCYMVDCRLLPLDADGYANL
jgi:translation elongation factor EF-4